MDICSIIVILAAYATVKKYQNHLSRSVYSDENMVGMEEGLFEAGQGWEIARTNGQAGANCVV
jgi:hypothetical protein